MAYAYPPPGVGPRPPRPPGPANPNFRPPPPHGHGPPKRPFPDYNNQGMKRPRFDSNAYQGDDYPGLQQVAGMIRNIAQAAAASDAAPATPATVAADFTSDEPPKPADPYAAGNEHIKSEDNYADNAYNTAGDPHAPEADPYSADSDPYASAPPGPPPPYMPRARAPRPPPPDDPYTRRQLPLGPLALEGPRARQELVDQLAIDRERYLAGLRALYPEPEGFRVALAEDRARLAARARARLPPPPPPRRYPDDPYDDYLPPPPPRRPLYDPYDDYPLPPRRPYPPPPPRPAYPDEYEEWGRGRGYPERRGGRGGYGDRGRGGFGDRGRGRGGFERGRGRGGFGERGRGRGGGGRGGRGGGAPQKDQTNNDNDDTQNEEKPKLICPAKDCDKKYRNDLALFHHWREQHTQYMYKFGCLICETQCKRSLGIRRHYVSEHGVEADDIMPWHNFVVVLDRKSRNAQYKEPGMKPPEGFFDWDNNLLNRFEYKSAANPSLIQHLHRCQYVREQGIPGTGDTRSKRFQELEDEKTALIKEAGIQYGDAPEPGSELAAKVQEIEDQKAALCRPGPELSAPY